MEAVQVLYSTRGGASKVRAMAPLMMKNAFEMASRLKSKKLNLVLSGAVALLVGLMTWWWLYAPDASLVSKKTKNRVPAKVLSADQVSSGLSRDQYSGKTVSSREMAYKLVMQRESNAPRVGELAPEFSLNTTSGDKVVSLTELRQDKPVVLIMGSYGCDVFRETVPGLLWLYGEYKDKVHFVMVYIREAHALNGFRSERTQVDDARTSGERLATARICQQQLKLPFTLLVDSIEDPVMTRWAAWPVRLYVVGTCGKVIYAGGQGPWGYKPYVGYQHGDGSQLKQDLQFNKESLAEFLEKQLSSYLRPEGNKVK